MPNNIIILDEVLASKIAAGEVVERPSSVVKELAENSIDANADRIEIEVHNGGKSLIRVTDNGSGMDPEDAKLSIERHATSKIKNIDDLFNISTLGFRGEALPSIASVSRFELLTSRNSRATHICVEGGKIIEEKESSAPKGTTIIVKDLFFNTPARMKYMKTDGTELSRISDIVSKFIISKPNIAFKLSSNGKETMSSSGNRNLSDAIASVYGSAFTKGLLSVSPLPRGRCPEGTKGVIGVTGFISKPAETKINKEYQLFFVNGRYVRNALLSKAVESAYSNLIPRDRHPAAVIFIDIDPKEIDVNVHPAKREIKFAKTGQIMEVLAEAARETLIDAAPAQLISTPNIDFKQPKWTRQEHRIWQEEMIGPIGQRDQDYQIDHLRAEYIQPLQTASLDPVRVGRDRPQPIFQLSNTYIICADGSDLVLIDQHAAHERILYEKINAGRISETNAQCCLIPEVVELTPKEFDQIEKNTGTLTGIGFDIEVFGKDSVRVKAVPSEMTDINIKETLSDIALQLEEEKKLKTDEAKEKIFKLVACHGAIKAGDKLNQKEMEKLIEEVYMTENPATCPHGRPSIVRIDHSNIAKLFDRNK